MYIEVSSLYGVSEWQVSWIGATTDEADHKQQPFFFSATAGAFFCRWRSWEALGSTAISLGCCQEADIRAENPGCLTDHPTETSDFNCHDLLRFTLEILDIKRCVANARACGGEYRWLCERDL